MFKIRVRFKGDFDPAVAYASFPNTSREAHYETREEAVQRTDELTRMFPTRVYWWEEVTPNETEPSLETTKLLNEGTRGTIAILHPKDVQRCPCGWRWPDVCTLRGPDTVEQRTHVEVEFKCPECQTEHIVRWGA